jgi:hypothetical protein
MSGRKPIYWPDVPSLPTAENILARQHCLLDFVAFMVSTVSMNESHKVLTALIAQVHADLKALKEIQREQNKLRAAYNRFCVLVDESRARVERIRRLIVMLWMHETVPRNKTVVEKAAELGIALPEGWETVTVWESVLEIIRQFPNTQLVDLLQWLQELGIEASRQSVDSALAAHAELFEVRRVGKGKYISLRKEGENASSTKRKRK